MWKLQKSNIIFNAIFQQIETIALFIQAAKLTRRNSKEEEEVEGKEEKDWKKRIIKRNLRI